jgi:hypothetical protein
MNEEMIYQSNVANQINSEGDEVVDAVYEDINTDAIQEEKKEPTLLDKLADAGLKAMSVIVTYNLGMNEKVKTFIVKQETTFEELIIRFRETPYGFKYKNECFVLGGPFHSVIEIPVKENAENGVAE